MIHIQNDNFMHKILRSIISGFIALFSVYLLLGNFISDIIVSENISDEVFNFLAIVFTMIISVLSFKDIRYFNALFGFIFAMILGFFITIFFAEYLRRIDGFYIFSGSFIYYSVLIFGLISAFGTFKNIRFFNFLAGSTTTMLVSFFYFSILFNNDFESQIMYLSMPILLTDNVKDLVEISIYMIFTIVGGVLAYKNSYFLKLLFSALIGSMFGILIFFVFESFSIIEEFMILNDLANLFLNIFAIGFGFFASFLSYKREILFDGLIGIFTVILIGAMFQIPNTYILLMSVTAFFIGIKSENFFIIIIESIIAFFTGILLSFILINTVFVNTILSKNEEMLNLIFGIIFILGVLFFNRKKQV